MSEVLVHRGSPRQIRRWVLRCLQAGLVPFVQSSPGMGKSSIMRSIAKELSLKCIDHRMSTSAPEDMSGLPRFTDDGFAEFAQFKDLFPLEGMDLPRNKNGEELEGWMLFLDEWNSAKKEVQAASYKLILDKQVGQKNLHERVVICAAGNLSTDRAIVNALSTAMQSRVVHLEMIVDFDEWLYDVALKEGYDSRIIGFLSMYKSKLMDFDPKHNEKTFCCPRTWEFMNALVTGEEVLPADAALYAGTITSGVATSFIQFCQIYKEMITVEDILKDPVDCRIPSDTAGKWAIVTAIMEVIDKDNFDDLVVYINRFSLDFKVLFFRSVMIRQPNLRNNKSFATAMQSLAIYLKG